MASFASSLFFLQLLLLTSLYTQNFGGALNHFLDEFLVASNQTFLDAFADHVAGYVSATREELYGAGYWKLSRNGYIASPILENWIGSCLILITFIYMKLIPKPEKNYEKATTSRSLYEMLKEVQTGVTLSFMVPINLSCINCLYAIVSSGIWTLWGVLSFLASILLLCYYAWFAVVILSRTG
jgi:hypothetical protein